MRQYLNLLDKLLTAPVKQGRNGKVQSLFAENLRFHMHEGFPLITTKFVSYKTVLAELLWFLSGSTDITQLWNLNCHIWDANFHSENWQNKIKTYNLPRFSTGYIYGAQWRDFNNSGIDQIGNLVDNLKTNPFSRRHVVSAWSPEELELMCLPPCHCMFICDVNAMGNTKFLNMHVTMRSCDAFLGLPFNIASYATLLHMLAQVTGMYATQLSFTLVNVHLYENAVEGAKLQLARSPMQLPELILDSSITDIFAFQREDFYLSNYKYHPAIKVDMVE